MSDTSDKITTHQLITDDLAFSEFVRFYNELRNLKKMV
jgi:hypothetical protein